MVFATGFCQWTLKCHIAMIKDYSSFQWPHKATESQAHEFRDWVVIVGLEERSVGVRSTATQVSHGAYWEFSKSIDA